MWFEMPWIFIYDILIYPDNIFYAKQQFEVA